MILKNIMHLSCGGFYMIKNKKTELKQVEEFLKKEGFTEISDKEKNSPEFRDSLLKIRNLKKANKSHKKIFS
jgi:hypothetical protein